MRLGMTASSDLTQNDGAVRRLIRGGAEAFPTAPGERLRTTLTVSVDRSPGDRSPHSPPSSHTLFLRALPSGVRLSPANHLLAALPLHCCTSLMADASSFLAPTDASAYCPLTPSPADHSSDEHAVEGTGLLSELDVPLPAVDCSWEPCAIISPTSKEKQSILSCIASGWLVQSLNLWRIARHYLLYIAGATVSAFVVAATSLTLWVALSGTRAPAETLLGSAHRPSHVLLVMSDSRPLEANASSALSLAIYINFQYSRVHPGTEFRYVSYDFDQSQVPDSERHSDPKDRASCYNAELHEYRAASWCKLQTVYQILTSNSSLDAFDYILFLDSDAVLSNFALSPDDFLQMSDTFATHCSIAQFLNDSDPCSILFMSNRPWVRELPNAGVWLVRPSKFGVDFVQHWWHLNNRYECKETHTSACTFNHSN